MIEKHKMHISSIVFDLKEFAHDLPHEVVNNYHETIESLFEPLRAVDKAYTELKAENELMRCCGNCKNHESLDVGDGPECLFYGECKRDGTETNKDHWEIKK